MKLFSTLFLSLALITGAAQANECRPEDNYDFSVNCDCDYDNNEINDNASDDCEEAPWIVPAEMPAELQEQLAWGLARYDLDVVQATLAAGANPYTLHKTNIFNTYIAEAPRVNAEEVCKYGEISPFWIMTAACNSFSQKNMFAMLECLLQKGVSVDRGAFLDYNRVETFRQNIKTTIEFYTNTPYQDIIVGANTINSLINKYQPETKA